MVAEEIHDESYDESRDITKGRSTDTNIILNTFGICLVKNATIFTDFTLRAKFNIKIAHLLHGHLEVKEKLSLVKGIAINNIPGRRSVG